VIEESETMDDVCDETLMKMQLLEPDHPEVWSSTDQDL
jgi:hypothetical protein